MFVRNESYLLARLKFGTRLCTAFPLSLMLCYVDCCPDLEICTPVVQWKTTSRVTFHIKSKS
jgi:hypothetical protein